MRIALIVNCPVSHKSMGGGDKTLIELAKVWQKLGATLTVFGPPEAKSVCQIGGLCANFVETSKHEASRLGTKKAYLLRIMDAILSRKKYGSFDFVYSASEALPDIVLSLRVKAQNPRAAWVVGFFLRARNPVFGEVPYSFSSLLQLIQQQLSLALMSLYKVTGVFVAGKPDETYIKNRGFKNILKIGGGVDLDFVKSIPEQEKMYDACFVGRISSQKGVDDLLEVWKDIIKVKPSAKLAFIGWGHKGDAEAYQEKVKTLDLADNIKFFGFLDGSEKYKIIKASKVSLFPSKYESFGIVLLESLACGVPVVAYDLPVLRDNFVTGVVYVSLGDTCAMAKEVISLLSDSAHNQGLSGEALNESLGFGWENIGNKTAGFLQSLVSL